MDERDARQELSDLIEERVAAVRAKDPGPLAARHADDVVTFDLLPPLMRRGPGPIIEKTDAWFAGYASDIGYDVHELDITTDGELGFCSFAYHITGTLQSGDEVDMWCRATLCCRRIDGTWRILHDHESVPFDPETGMGVLHAEP